MKAKSVAMSAILVLLLGIVGGCATFKEAKPETVPQKLVYAYGLLDGVATTVEALYRNGLLDKKQTMDTYDALQVTWKTLDAAQGLYYDGKNGEYEAMLNESIRSIEAIRAYLIKRRGK